MVAGMIRFADGRAVGLSISWAAHTGDGYWLRVFGTKGGAQLSPEVVIYRTEGGAMVDVRPQLPKVNSYAEEMEHFADCVKKGQEPISPGSQAVVVMEMLDGIYRAARSGRAATIRHD
jgi:predicted dehydrogenase